MGERTGFDFLISFCTPGPFLDEWVDATTFLTPDATLDALFAIGFCPPLGFGLLEEVLLGDDTTFFALKGATLFGAFGATSLEFFCTTFLTTIFSGVLDVFFAIIFEGDFTAERAALRVGPLDKLLDAPLMALAF